MSTRTLLGMLTPSSNTTLEPVTAQMISGLPEVSAHFGRFRVTEIALSDNALGDNSPVAMRILDPSGPARRAATINTAPVLSSAGMAACIALLLGVAFFGLRRRLPA